VTIAVGITVSVRVLTGPLPDEWEYAMAVYLGMLGLPWSMSFSGGWIFAGLVINAVILFIVGAWLDVDPGPA